MKTKNDIDNRLHFDDPIVPAAAPLREDHQVLYI